MADSDEEYDKKIRDKFRGERDRNDHHSDARSFDRHDSRRREEWPDRGDPWRQRGRGDYRPNIRDRGSPGRHDQFPPMKRMRPDWEERRFYEPPYAYGSWMATAESHAQAIKMPAAATQSGSGGGGGGGESAENASTMMTLKQFLNTVEDNLSDEEALRKYNEYKANYRKQQVHEFFVAHKDEEWFKEKYHPVISKERNEIHAEFIKKRVDLFMEFLENGWIESVRVNTDHSENLTKLMDAFVMRLENCTLEDVETAGLSLNGSSKRTKTKGNVKGMESSKAEGKEINDHTVTTTQEEVDGGGKGESDKNGTPDENGKDEKEEGEEEEEEEGKEKGEVDEENEKAKRKEKKDVRTSSIFLRDLAPSITRGEIEALCSRYDGFLRLSIADPQPDKKWHRKGWITFKREVDVKDICWNLSSVKLRDVEVNPIVNRDLAKRVRSVGTVTNNKHVVRNDLKLCTRVITNFDKKFGLWESADEKDTKIGLSSNPVLRNITSYLIEEASAEEEELLGEKEVEETVETNDDVFKVLDRMILYLRFVHSIDFYNHCEYPNEDEMPNRCGILHARIAAVDSKLSLEDAMEYCKSFEGKLKRLMEPDVELKEDKLRDLGMKEAEAEVEKFIQANTQELGPLKWLCPLSGKKFKGPEFISKHILNKHGDKVEEVRDEVQYFNNYLKDPKRPAELEPQNSKTAPKEIATLASTGPLLAAPPVHPNPYHQFGYPPNAGPGLFPPGPMAARLNYGGAPPYGGGGRGGLRNNYRGGGGGGRGSHSDGRPLIHYRDLDAPPKELEELI